MKSIKIYCLGLLTTCFLFACGPSLKVSSDYDHAVNFTGYKTFNVYHLKTTGSVSQLNADRIVNAIKANMISKGFTETETNPDLMINAITQLKNAQSVTANTSVYGYGGGYRPYGYWGGGGGMATGTTTYNTYDYKKGTFTIDIVDAKTQKLVWQGVGSADIDQMPKDPDAAITAGVTKIMASFPPGNTK